VIIAGANGAGKTTFARNLLPVSHPDCLFLNADEIQREGGKFATPSGAGRELLRRLENRLSTGESFAVETTLSSTNYARRIPGWRRRGYLTTLYFLQAVSADFVVARVAQRVAAGGHGIPEPDIRRRFMRGIQLFQPTKRWLTCGIMSVSMKRVRSLSPKAPPKTPTSPAERLALVKDALRRATEEATKGPREARSGRFDWKPKPKAAE
jgi:predicted ABC-type ATPase